MATKPNDVQAATESNASSVAAPSAPGTILITGGGTAGHTNPGIAVAQALSAAGLRSGQIHFVGAKRGNEGTLVPEAGFTIDLLSGRGIKRSLSPSGIKDNIGAVAGLVGGFAKALAIVAKRKPVAVLCLGGYAAAPASSAAVLLRRPLIVSEQNARASAVNRLFGPRAARCALPFPDTDLPNGELTGNPIRTEVLGAVANADRSTARRAIAERYRDEQDGSGNAELVEAFHTRTIIAVWAGSLGATKVNTAIAELAIRWKDRNDLVLYHVVGRRDWDRFQAPPLDLSGLAYLTVDYENHMADVLVGADVAVCRAGASTVSELSVAGLPSILVPLPNAPRDHQRANTAELAAAGGAIVVDDEEVTGERLEQELAPLLTDRTRLEAMRTATLSVSRPLAAAAVAELLMEAGGLR